MNFDPKSIERKLNITLFKLNLDARIKLWRKLGKQLSDGINILVAIDELQKTRSKSDPMHIALGEWSSAMKNGRKFWEAVKEWVTTEESMLLMAGEQAGELPAAFASVVTVAKSRRLIIGAVWSGLSYPTFLVLLSFGVMYLFSYKITPAFSMAARSDAWTGWAKTMVNTSTFMQNWFHWIALAFIIGIIALIASMPRWSGLSRVPFDRFPPYSIYRIMQGSSWIIALSALIQAGMRLETALEKLMNTSSEWTRVRTYAALRAIKSGKNLGDALLLSKFEFPDMEIISDIRVYANKSGFDEALRIIGDEWIGESVERIQAMMRKVFAATLVLAGGVIAFQVSGMFAMQMQLTQIIQQAGR